MHQRFSAFPRYLAERARSVRLGPAPAMVAHPDWATLRPAVLWFHGRTASKELDPGRYLRWLRGPDAEPGLAAIAVDLPFHGERLDERMHHPAHTLEILEQAVTEVDEIVASLRETALREGWPIDLTRIGIGGMSLGGMVTLRRLCDPHPFRCAAVEGTAGWLEGMYYPGEHGLTSPPWPVDHPRERVRRLDPAGHLTTFSPLPLLDLHSLADEMVPFEPQARFIEMLRGHYERQGADPSLVTLVTWPTTGAPREHIGFGRVSNEAKTIQTDFFRRHLLG